MISSGQDAVYHLVHCAVSAQDDNRMGLLLAGPACQFTCMTRMISRYQRKGKPLMVEDALDAMDFVSTPAPAGTLIGNNDIGAHECIVRQLVLTDNTVLGLALLVGRPSHNLSEPSVPVL